MHPFPLVIHLLPQFFVSNPFDVVGAGRAGFNTIWVDRSGKGWVDQLGKPNNIVKNLKEFIDIVKAA